MSSTLSVINDTSSPPFYRLDSTDTLETILNSAYLSNPQNGININDGDAIAAYYLNGGVAGLQASVTLGVVTLLYIDRLRARSTPVWGGGSTSNAFSAPGLFSYSVVTASILSQTNTASIVSVVPSTDTLTVTFSADPGANTVINYIAVTPAT